VATANEEAREAITDETLQSDSLGDCDWVDCHHFGSAVTPQLHDFPAVIL